MANKLKIRKGDRVKVITGRSKGKVGDVLRVLPEENRVVVSGVNVIKRHIKPDTLSVFVAGDFAGAATTFNEVTYGERPGTEPGYRMIADLDDRLRSHASAGAGAVRAVEPADTWTPIR
mgnify:CR=1 FL=1